MDLYNTFDQCTSFNSIKSYLELSKVNILNCDMEHW